MDRHSFLPVDGRAYEDFEKKNLDWSIRSDGQSQNFQIG